MGDANMIQDEVKEFILKEFLAGEDPEMLQADTELITTGVLDSIATLKLVSFLENKFNIRLEAHESGVDYLNNLADITRLVQSKQGK